MLLRLHKPELAIIRKTAIIISVIGRVSEWFKEPVLKTGVPATVPWVRIPPLPPNKKDLYCRSFLFLEKPCGFETII
jgi:hypothetical protein